MKKSELVALVADIADISMNQADDAVAALFEQITNALARGESVSLIGFGHFTVKTRASRMGRNPKTGADIIIPSGKQMSFKAGKGLKDAVNAI